MTTEEEIKSLKEELICAKRYVDNLEKDLKEAKDKCIHIYDSGFGAMQSGMFCNTCNICGWDDL